MKNVGMKADSYRTAVATGILYAPAHCIELLRTGNTEKGDALKTARIAGILAAKRTDELIPLCHPLPIYRADVEYELHEQHVEIIATVETIAPTGVEMEALTAVSLAGLTLYDMLKPHCEPEDLCLDQCKLQLKKGGKSHFTRTLKQTLSASIPLLQEKNLIQQGKIQVNYQVIADSPEQLLALIEQQKNHYPLILTVGGTGLGPKDLTVETIQPLLQREIPGLMEASRSFGQRRTPYAALSRGIAGYIDTSLVITLPGSRQGAKESLIAILPALVHLFDVQKNIPHVGGYQ
ncbi:unnamed protein product [Oppiella nova]|uniref:MoaB/Mog domain-containing protein n=1 Tax=Oppiella nova TaxID=334625 RepID=A0A7R9QFZ1_9ACAR|nr:unnamed protein product [Oppiella nova]CAG2164609.1 unnamed protein product [Oppiella nova]